MKYDLLGKAVRRFRLPVVDYSDAPITIIPVQEGDVNSRFFEVTLYDDKGNLDLRAYTRIILNGVTPSGVLLTTDKCEIKEDGSAVIINFGGGFAAKPGRITCEILLTNAEQNVALTTRSFYVIVSESQYERIVMENEDECNELLLLLKEVEGVENKIKAAEEIRVASETERISAENNRQEAEENRINAENERLESEQERNANEGIRNTAEDLRLSNEETRVQNEIERVNAENVRKDAEQERNAQEDIRISNEDFRSENEEARINAENTRIQSEQGRINAEILRETSEQERIAEEEIRIVNEQNRNNNEEIRINAETARVEAELKRETGFAETKEIIDNIASDINQKLESGYFDGKDGISIENITSGHYEVVGKNTITPVTITKTDGSSYTFQVEARNGADGNGSSAVDTNEELLWEGEKSEAEFYQFIKEGEFSEEGVVLGTNNRLRHLWKVLDDVNFNNGDVLKIEGYAQTINNGYISNKQKIVMNFKCLETYTATLSEVLGGGSEIFDGLISDEELSKTISMFSFGIKGTSEILANNELGYIEYEGDRRVEYLRPFETIDFSYVLGGEIYSANLRALKDLEIKLKELGIDNDVIKELSSLYEYCNGFNFAFTRYLDHNSNINNSPKKTNVWWKYKEEDKSLDRSALMLIRRAQNQRYYGSYQNQLVLNYEFPEKSTNANLPLFITRITVTRTGD